MLAILEGILAGASGAKRWATSLSVLGQMLASQQRA